MNLLVWVIYNDCDELMGVCATAEDCACYLVERGDAGRRTLRRITSSPTF